MKTEEEKKSILYLEDSEDDAELMIRALKKSGLPHSLKIVSSKEEFLKVDYQAYDLIISDYNLKKYDGLSAIKHVRSLTYDIPVIIFSGTVGEELATELLKSGANDFVLKSSIKKIPIVIERVLKETMIAQEKRRFQRELVEKNLILDSIFDSFDDLIFLKDDSSKYLKVNRAFCEFFNKHESELTGVTDLEIVPKDVANQSMEQDEYVRISGKPVNYEIELNIDGNRKIMEVIKNPVISNDKVTGIIGKMQDITTKKILLEETIKAKSILSQAEKLTRSGSFEYDTDLDLITCNSNFKHILRLPIAGDTISFRKFTQLIKEEDRPIFNEGINKAIENYTEYYNEHRFMVGTGDFAKLCYFKIALRPDFKDSNSTRFFGTIVDVTTEHENQIYLMDKQERERKEIARELHDNLGQKMNGISMFISKISDNLPENNDLEKVRSLVHETIDDLSFLINNISVKQVEEHSLSYAIDKLINYMPESFNVDREFSFKEEALSPFVKSQIFRVVQEVLNNAVKYSEASIVNLTLKQEGGILSLMIKDNGKGFEMDKVLDGNGMQNIIHRVRSSNGLIDIDSKKGAGTKISVKMPVN